MEMGTDYDGPGTSALPYENVSFSKTEDSGYHTFTPESLESAELSNDFLEQSILTGITSRIQFSYFHATPEANNHRRRYTNSTGHGSKSGTPPFRRGCKRPHSSTIEKIETVHKYTSDTVINTVPTPTTFIAGKIKSLNVNENKENSEILSPISSQCSEKFKRHLFQHHDFDQILAYPTTPVKKNCIHSPCRKSVRNLNFTIHSLSCESNELQNAYKPRASKVVRNINFWPDQKVDIIQKLYKDAGAVPPIMKILSYLSNEDISNFSIVWSNVWKSISDNNKKKREYEGYLKTLKENQENKDKGITPKTNFMKPLRRLKEINNEVNNNPVKILAGNSPPGSPRTNRFRKFTKSASLDSRCQLSCVRCCLPAKVTEEPSGEVWVDCTSKSCLYQFCRFCKCPRHTGKSCFQYDLNGPSPSKRKKSQYAIGTKKSRRNLLRL